MHGSSVMNAATQEIFSAYGPVYWFEPSGSRSIADIGQISGKALLISAVHLIRYTMRSFRQRRRYVAYLSIAVDGWARWRDLVAWAIAGVCAARVVVHVHSAQVGRAFFCHPLAPLSRWLLTRSEVWILHESFLTAELLSQARHVEVIENGISCAAMEHAENLKLSLAPADGPRPVHVVFLANHIREKGPLFVAQAAERVLNKDPEGYRFHFVGAAVDGQVENRLALLASRYRSVVRIRTPTASDKCRLLSQADLLCLPSTYALEGQPLVLLEAACHGTPVAVTDFAALKATAGPTGTVVSEPDDLAAELEAIASLTSDIRWSSRQRTLAHWRRTYSLEAYARRVAAALHWEEPRNQGGRRPSQGP